MQNNIRQPKYLLVQAISSVSLLSFTDFHIPLFDSISDSWTVLVGSPTRRFSDDSCPNQNTHVLLLPLLPLFLHTLFQPQGISHLQLPRSLQTLAHYFKPVPQFQMGFLLTLKSDPYPWIHSNPVTLFLAAITLQPQRNKPKWLNFVASKASILSLMPQSPSQSVLGRWTLPSSMRD